MASISKAYQWVITTCNAENVGYSQTYRNGQTVNGITYYDCSSLLYWALIAGGFDLDPTANAFTTATMGNVLLKLGFKIIPIGDPWKAGDILLRSGHTEMVYSGRITMGAHTDSYTLAEQVSINTFSSAVSSWTTCYRYGSGATNENSWIFGNRYLTEKEMQNNAICVYLELMARNWTLNAIAGLLGNIETESTINPALWQSLNEGNYSRGYGLVQWTPATNYTEWATSNNYDITDGNKQLQWIDEETENEGQWIKTDLYNLSFEEFKLSHLEPEELASAFLKNFERAGVEVEEERRSQARKWYDYLIKHKVITGIIKKKKGFNFLLFKKKGRTKK